MDKKSISNAIRQKTGKPLTMFARKLNIERQTLYDAIGGKGGQRTRIEIAKVIGTLPSMIWTDMDEKKRIIDDLEFNRSQRK